MTGTDSRHARRETTLEDLAVLLEELVDATRDQTQAIGELAAASGPDLYCPPNEWCPGGIRLRRSTVFEANLSPEKRRDKFFHPLPREKWHDLETERGTFHVHSHNVWRSASLSWDECLRRGLVSMEGDADDDAGEPDVDRQTGEMLTPKSAAQIVTAPSPALTPPGAAGGRQRQRSVPPGQAPRDCPACPGIALTAAQKPETWGHRIDGGLRLHMVTLDEHRIPVVAVTDPTGKPVEVAR